MDLSKAFDTINHAFLFDKLYRFGFGGISYAWSEDLEYGSILNDFFFQNATIKVNLKRKCINSCNPGAAH